MHIGMTVVWHLFPNNSNTIFAAASDHKLPYRVTKELHTCIPAAPTGQDSLTQTTSLKEYSITSWSLEAHRLRDVQETNTPSGFLDQLVIRESITQECKHEEDSVTDSRT